MKSRQFLSIGILSCLLAMNSNAQQDQRIKPFTISAFGVTVTGTYSEGHMYRNAVNGANVLFGLITWSGSETIECRPGPAVCRIEQILSFQVNKTIINEKGEKGFQSSKVNDGTTPVVIGVGETGITFAVDITQVSEKKRTLYSGSEWRVDNGFVLAPNVVRALNLYNGPEEKGYLIPAGNYPLYKDGNIAYWTFQKPQQQ